jgi:hypothetical protein
MEKLEITIVMKSEIKSQLEDHLYRIIKSCYKLDSIDTIHVTQFDKNGKPYNRIDATRQKLHEEA